MPSRDRFRALCQAQDSVFTRAEAAAAGVSGDSLDRAAGLDGPWQRVLPRVYVPFLGGRSDRQQRVAALKFGGPLAMLAGRTAVEAHGLRYVSRPEQQPRVHILVPVGASVRSRGFVAVLQTHRPERRPVTHDGLPVCSAARAVADASRRITALRDVRALVAESVQRGVTTIGRLERELRAGPSAGSRLLRRALGEVDAGIRSVGEAELRDVVLAAGLPEPEWNAVILDDNGDFLACVDALWRGLRLVLESDSVEYHLDPAGWAETLRRHNRLLAAGYAVLHYPPSRVRRTPGEVSVEVLAAYARAARAVPAM